MQLRTFILAALAFAGTAIPQELPPEVLLLSRIKAHMADKFERLPDYTCLETVRRFYKPAESKENLKFVDTVRLEILYSQHRDFYASPGERQFEGADAASFIGSGMIASGFVTLALKNALLAGGSILTYRGEEEVGGQKAVKYDFRLSRMESGYTMDVVGGKAVVGLAGTLWADPQTLEVLRMEDRAVDIPPFLPVEESSASVNYRPIRIGDRDELLPQGAELYLRLPSGQESRNFFEFTHCGSFRTESAIHFDTDVIRPSKTVDTERPGPVPPASPAQTVPALLAVTVQLSTPITEGQSVGSPIEGRVAADVKYKGKVILPRGSLVRGRLRRLERATDVDGYFVVGLEFTEIQVNGAAMRFYADLLKFERAPGILPALSRQRFVHGIGGTETITLPDLPGVASFFVRGKTLTLPPEMQMVWRTRGYLR